MLLCIHKKSHGRQHVESVRMQEELCLDLIQLSLRHILRAYGQGNGTLQRHKNQVILHASVLKYVEQIHRVYDCREELYKFGQRGYFVGGYEYNSENSSCRIIEYISLVNYDNNTFLPSNSTDTYLYTSSKCKYFTKDNNQKQSKEELQELDVFECSTEHPYLNEKGVVEYSRNIPPISVSLPYEKNHFSFE
ncbi:unnamed protein product [Mytilus edulis]|uniref:Uncharacterized protein n=1 Tax=Mytilus edulis TaxID=6550 RepID=A0A8S3RD43_MYTED|nr:unnamed protein product [Mytilus edulis]